MKQLSGKSEGVIITAMLACSSLLSAQSPHITDQAALQPGIDAAELSEPVGHYVSSSFSSDPLPDAPQPAAPFSRSPNTSAASVQTSSFPDPHQRFHNYLAGAFGPGAFIAAGISSAVDQTHSLKVGFPSDGFPGTGNHPDHGTVPEWGEGFDGYAKRYASRYGMSLVSTTTRYGLGEVLHEDVSYHKCECTGTFQRTAHAVEQSFVAHTASGKAVPSLPALVAPFIGAEVGVAGWYPARYNASDALRTSTNLYISAPVQNIVNEFLRR